MPMILGYQDTDISADARFNPYILQVPNTNEPIYWPQVIAFYKELANNPNHRMEIAALANKVLSMENKAAHYVAFMRGRLNATQTK